MPEVELNAGVVEYDDTGGTGPILVFLHGLMMDGTVWDDVVARLPDGYRCIRPTLPLGGHRIPMNVDADLSLLGLGLLVGEFLERLDLHDVTLVQNDWGGVQVLIANGSAERIGRLVITSCEAYENYPPGVPGAAIGVALRIPGGLRAMLFGLRFTAVRRAPGSWGWMSRTPVPKHVMDRWFAPATHDRLIRRDLRKYGLSVPDDDTLLRWTDACREFDRPVLVVWGHDDKIMPIEHGRRLSRLFPDASIVELRDTYTLVPINQPERLATEIAAFVPRR